MKVKEQLIFMSKINFCTCQESLRSAAPEPAPEPAAAPVVVEVYANDIDVIDPAVPVEEVRIKMRICTQHSHTQTFCHIRWLLQHSAVDYFCNIF